MKKLILFLIFCIATIAASYAQSTSPRFGTAANQDNTGRVLTYNLVAVTDVAGSDTVYVQANAYNTYYKVASLDSVTFKIKSVTKACFGDKISILAQATSGSPKIKFYETNNLLLTAGTATMSSKRRIAITLWFDGAKWIEAGRIVQ